jgi:hypothetical protein
LDPVKLTETPVVSVTTNYPESSSPVQDNAGKELPLFVIANQGESSLEWNLIGVYQDASGRAAPIVTGIVGVNSFTVYETLRSDPDLSKRFLFINLGDEWTSKTIAPMDFLVVSEKAGGLLPEELDGLSEFQKSGRSIVMAITQIEKETKQFQQVISKLFGTGFASVGSLSGGELNITHAIARGSTLELVNSSLTSFQGGEATWVVREASGRSLVTALNRKARFVMFGGDLVAWQQSNPVLVRNALVWAGTSWLFLDPISGETLPGQETVISSTLDARGFLAGAHSLVALVETNDPLAPKIQIPMTLTVTGDPQIELSSTDIDFEQVFFGQEVSKRIQVVNNGIADLRVDIAPNSPSIVVTPITFVVPPLGMQSIQFAFRPDSSQLLSTTVVIRTNIPATPTQIITVQGEAVDPPIMMISTSDLVQSEIYTVGLESAQILIGTPKLFQATVSSTAMPISEP